MKLPNQRNIVLSDILIGADEDHLFGNGGCDKKAVKRITVKQRQRFKGGQMIGFYRENDKTIGFHKMNETRGFAVKFKFSQRGFYCKFPNGDYTQMYLVRKIKNYFSGGCRKSFVSVEIPDCRVCIKRGTFALWAWLRFKQITTHLHIVLEVLKRRVKVVRHPKFTPCTTKSAPFSAFHHRLRSKGKNSLPRRNFGRHINGQPMISRYCNSLCNTHGVNIA